jgi:hypothetical protein
MNKPATAKDIVAHVQSLAPITDKNAALVAEYFDAGTFTDADVTSLGITAADLTACITLLQQIGLFMGGSAVITAQYRATLNKVRRSAT